MASNSNNNTDSASNSASTNDFRKMISLKDCVGCKLVTVPLFYMVGLHMAMKNFNLYKDFTHVKNAVKVS